MGIYTSEHPNLEMASSKTHQQAKRDSIVKSDETQPLIGAVLTTFDLKDRRILVFWFIELAGSLAFLFWLYVVMHLPRVPAIPGLWSTGAFRSYSGFNVPFASTLARGPGNDINVQEAERSAKDLSADVWFSLGFGATLDAFVVVATFNRILIKRFHYAVSLRMMILASTISFGVFIWKSETVTSILHIFASCVLLFFLYLLSGLVLDGFDSPLSTIGACYQRWTFQQCSENLSLFDVPWMRAFILTMVTGGTGFLLTIFTPPSWSTLIPVVHIAFESVFLAAVKCGRTPRYILISSPIFQSTICVHWGLRVVSLAPRLTIPPWAFLSLVMVSRLLLDIHLWTIFRLRRELNWAREEILVSTYKLLGIYSAIFLLDKMGLKVITYIKLVSVPLFFLITTMGYLAPAAYVVAFARTKAVRI